MAVFLKEKSDDYPNGYWWLVTDGELLEGSEVVLENRFGGHHEHTFNKAEDEVATASSWDDLDWSSVLLLDESKFGYIDPFGKWYGCRQGDHSLVCRYILHEDNPEEFGWVKVFMSSYGIAFYSRRRFLTDAQNKVLIELGIDV